MTMVTQFPPALYRSQRRPCQPPRVLPPRRRIPWQHLGFAACWALALALEAVAATSSWPATGGLLDDSTALTAVALPLAVGARLLEPRRRR